MFSVTNTGTNFRPLWTAKVSPTESGTMVERRDQVLITFLELVAFAAWIFSIRWPSTNGPFLTLRGMAQPFVPRRRMIIPSVRLLFRVLNPLASWPHGEHGWRPPEVRPSPPPMGWSTGFMVTPRLCGRRPSQRERPALPSEMFAWSGFET